MLNVDRTIDKSIDEDSRNGVSILARDRHLGPVPLSVAGFFFEGTMKCEDTYGRWTIIRESAHRSRNRGRRFLCRCTCGTERDVRADALVSGESKSCGCLMKEQCKDRFMKHGFTSGIGRKNPRLYQIWLDMRNRCRNKKHRHFHRYGGRGIGACAEWEDYAKFHSWAMANGYAPNLTIERKNNDKGYSPDNCQWATMKLQGNNRVTNVQITFKEKTKSRQRWAEELGISSNALKFRLKHWSIEDALTKLPKN